MSQSLEVRPARPDERDAVLRVANASFSRPDKPFDFAALLPYCFTGARLPDHWLCLREGTLLGLIGVYPFSVRLAGVEFRSAGIGQVATLPEARGQGVMSELLARATAEMDQRYDFTWLWGDRLRYGRYGWAIGGVTCVYESYDKYLPAPPPAEEVRPLDVRADFDRIYAATMRQPYTVGFSPDEFRLLLGTAEISGLAWRDGWVLCRPHPSRVVLAEGDEATVAGLLAHIAHQGKQSPENRWKVEIETGPFDSVLTRVARKHYWHVNRPAAASFRLCEMVGYFEKVIQAVKTPPGGTGELSLRNSDNGQEVRLLCRDGQFAVEPQAGPDPIQLSTIDLSEALFGPLPLETTLPGLDPATPLRPLLTLPVHLAHLFAL